MKNKKAEEVAKHINEDRQGAAYYKDPDVLAPYLKKQPECFRRYGTRHGETYL